ncbi:hypothetical protein Trco_006876 [Trichoderma cornu-damae]|uniref:Uncharacterized protein n=1 Tax=Trichoderma cornu-damae TaxID=654480 RepID=A0A9P8TVF2_9HYPO|nr:hypothetical protein Trco_006876 [Trichoderma cornu-damae]
MYRIVLDCPLVVMRDDQFARSPDRGRDRERNRDSRHPRSRDFQHRPDDDDQQSRQGKDTARALVGD